MKNKLFVFVMLSAGLYSIMLTGCIIVETDQVEIGTLEITLDGEDTKDLPYRYVFSAQHQDNEEYYHECSDTDPQTIADNSWKHTIEVMNVGDWKLSVYAVEEGYNAENLETEAVRKIVNEEFLIEVDKITSVEITLD